MGLSSSKSKTKTNQTQNQVTSGTQTPITPGYITEGLQDYIGGIREFAGLDPNSLVAGPSSLQQSAWANAGSLGGWQGANAQAQALAANAGNSGANLAPQSFSYTAPQLGQAATMTGVGYQAPTLGPAAQANATDAQAASLLDNFAAYQSPYTQQVVDASLAEYDQGVAEQQAQLAARGAAAGAFGGSRFGIAEGQLAADAARGRATTAAGLLDQGFRTAAGLSQFDAANRQQTNLFNAGQRTSVDLANAGARNQFGLAQAGFNENASRYGADATNRANEFNAGAQNNFSLNQAALDQAAGQFNTGLAAELARFNAGQQDIAANRGLQAAGVLGGLASDQGANQRADLQTQAALGDQQRSISQQQALARLAQLQAAGGLFSQVPYDALVGRQLNGTASGTMQGTSTTKQSGSLFDSILALGSLALPFPK